MFRQWDSPEAAFQIMKNISRDQPCDITGIEDYAMIDRKGGIQWPLAETDEQVRNNRKDMSQQQRRLFENGKFFTPDGRARFIFDPPRPVAEPTDVDYPFVLMTGRGSSAQWHTGSRTNKSEVLRGLAPAGCYVEINPYDAEHFNIRPGGSLRIASRRGSITAAAFVTANVQPGHLFVPMHYAEVNQLTFASFDPHSRQPSYKHCAVSVRAAT